MYRNIWHDCSGTCTKYIRFFPVGRRFLHRRSVKGFARCYIVKEQMHTNVDVKESNRMKPPLILSSFLFCLSLGAMPCCADPAKVIIDTDFNTIGDDGQVAAMAAQLYAQGTIDLLGFTIPSGNSWRDQEVSDCLKAVEQLGIEDRVKVYVGAVSNFTRLQGLPLGSTAIW
jgi:hypothetical protein